MKIIISFLTILLLANMSIAQDAIKPTTGKLFKVENWDSTRVLLPLDTKRINDEEYMLGRQFDSLSVEHEVNIDLIITEIKGDKMHTYIEFKINSYWTVKKWIKTEDYVPD